MELQAVLLSIDEALPICKIRDLLDRLEMSADAKALVIDIAGVTIKVGEKLVAIGRKIISFALGLAQQYPNTVFGLVIGLILGTLISSVPLVGWLLGPFLSPLLLALGLSFGAVADFTTVSIRSRIAVLERQLAVLPSKV